MALSTAAADDFSASKRQGIANFTRFEDPHGQYASYSTSGFIDTTGPFFQKLGTNGRSCVSCHEPQTGWTIIPQEVQFRFLLTRGRDPIFRPVDGAGCPTQNVSTVAAKLRAYQLLMNKGLIRIGMPMPANAEFSVVQVENPYGCNRTDELSMYRRPLPIANVAYLSTAMWDGRENTKGQTMIQNLEHQSNTAVMVHAEGTVPLTNEQRQQIVDFETDLFTAQVRDRRAGELDDHEALGGPLNLAQTDYFTGINDPLGGNPSGRDFTPEIFTMFSAWMNERSHDWRDAERSEARKAVARGEKLFNTLQIPIAGVAGLNDVPLNDGQIHPLINGFCGTCHDSPNIGHHSVALPINIGVADASRRTPDLPLITLQNKVTGEVISTTDPGRAMVTGKWADIGKFKGPILRGLPNRAPYFHNGMAANLGEVVDFYNTRFTLHLDDRQKQDLVAFLKTL